MKNKIYFQTNLLIFFFIASAFYSSRLSAQCDPVSDSLVLVSIYNATAEEGYDNTNWLVEGQPIADWQGVTVDVGGCVIGIDFDGVAGRPSLIGDIPLEFINLLNLLTLDIRGSQITGNIPPELENLTDLQTLRISGSNITGSIPMELGNLTDLQTLRILGSNITGSIPSELGGLVNLETLRISGNNITGSIPSELGGLVDLETLSISGNNITGSIPSELGSLLNLRELRIKGDQITGGIPMELGNLSKLRRLIISYTSVTGSIPPELGGLLDLIALDLSFNALTGEIPPEIGSFPSLFSLRLGKNYLTGSIPSEVGDLSSLNYLNFAYNNLTGSIPAELWNISHLSTCDLVYNSLTGEIPEGIGGLLNLTYLYLNNNELEGSIPSDIVGALGLHILCLQYNNLVGSIPEGFGDIPFFAGFDLSHNELEGSIPSDLGETRLNSFNCSFNNIEGSIPAELGNMDKLISLYLNDNQLTGRLPIELSYLSNLRKISLANNQLDGCFPPPYSIFCLIDIANFSDNPGLYNGGDFNAFCENEEGACEFVITGQVTLDENENCTVDTLEVGLQQWMIKATSVSGELYGVSDTNGYYRIYTYPEEYTVELIFPGPYLVENCTEEITTNIIDSLYIDTLNFFPNVLVKCPFMTVDISTPFLRRCFANTYVVSYCNNGTALAEGAAVVVQFDDLIDIGSASIAISEQVDNVLTFDLGDIAVNECGSFFIYTNTSCDSELEQALCVTAHVYPDSICAEISPEWSGATVEVGGDCDGDEVTFIIENTGEGDMLQDRTYIVIEDGLILMVEPEPFILNSNGDVEITYPANGSTYICQAMQVDNHPVPSMPTAFVEGCGVNEDGGFSTGYVTQFPEDDNTPFVSIDCQEVIGSFDPNDKNGYPKGYGEEHFIERGQDVDYHIRFQNTGTDTAFTVVVEDVLSANLEMTSLRLGASSHPYSVEIEGSSTLKFIFENILLPDSTTNEPLSHGFVKFKISQKIDLDLGAMIENQAAIFFDFNEAILTNTTLHTIGENFVQIAVIEAPLIPNLKVSLAPNPMVNEAIIRISGIDFKSAQLSLFNTLGVLLREETFNGNEVTLKRGNLSTGIYFFEIIVDGQKGFAGKMVVE